MLDRLHREVLEAKRRLEGIVDSAMDAIITIDEQQLIILFNPAAERMFGTSKADALGRPISLLIPHRFRAGHDEHIVRFRQTGVTGRRMGALGAISGLRAGGEEFPIGASISQVDVDGERMATVILRDITERLANEEARLLLAREVDHRAKNALAVVQALVSQTTAPTTEDFIAAVRGRISALGRAHSLLALNRWQGGDLRTVISEEIGPYHKPGQLRTQGPEIVLSANAVQPFSLFMHELATNAVKHGALSRPHGRVVIEWYVRDDGDLVLEWLESGGPAVSESSSEGFGTTLMSTVVRQLGGNLTVGWPIEGVHVTAMLPKVQYRVIANKEDMAGDDLREQTNCRILIVEDELLVGMEMSKALTAEGWDVVGPIGTVEEAFSVLSDGSQFDVAVLDINLNGQLVYPVADLLRTQAIPYLFCTGYDTIHADVRPGHKSIIRKPTNLRILIDEVRQLCCDFDPDPERRKAA